VRNGHHAVADPTRGQYVMRRRPHILAKLDVTGRAQVAVWSSGTARLESALHWSPGRIWIVPDSVYRVTEVIGTSTDSWEAAARNAVETAARTVRDLRVAEVEKLDVTIENGKVTSYRARVSISFKYETGD
jgi:flavin-binding protein dodecin